MFSCFAKHLFAAAFAPVSPGYELAYYFKDDDMALRPTASWVRIILNQETSTVIYVREYLVLGDNEIIFYAFTAKNTGIYRSTLTDNYYNLTAKITNKITPKVTDHLSVIWRSFTWGKCGDIEFADKRMPRELENLVLSEVGLGVAFSKTDIPTRYSEMMDLFEIASKENASHEIEKWFQKTIKAGGNTPQKVSKNILEPAEMPEGGMTLRSG